MTEIIEYINIAAVGLYCVSLIMLGKYYFNNRKLKNKHAIKQKIKSMFLHKEIGHKIEDLNKSVNEVRLKIKIPSTK